MDRDLHLPEHGDPTATAVVVHPHPGMGGDRHHPLVVAVAERLAEERVAALRIDLSDPDPVPSARALTDIATELLADHATERLLLVGYSWGAAVASLVHHDALAARVLIAPPVSLLGPADGTGDGTPTLVLVPAHDQFGPPDAVREALADRPATTIEVVEGADHFVSGAVDRIADRAVGWVVSAG